MSVGSEALMEIALVIVIVAIMIGMTQDLGSVLTMMMVRPLEAWLPTPQANRASTVDETSQTRKKTGETSWMPMIVDLP